MCFFLGSALASAQTYQISTVAGFGTFFGDGGPATAALLNPSAVVADAHGNLYVSDPGNFRIRKIDSAGTITTLIGQGYAGLSGDGGPATAALISGSYSLALDTAGNLYFTDDQNLRVREITAAGTVQEVAGSGVCGTVTAGMAASQAPLCDVESVAVDAQGHVYFASESQIWMVAANGTLTLIAGTGGTLNNGDNGPATAAQIGFPLSMAIDSNGNLYIGDIYNRVIREVTTDKIIHTVSTINDNNATGIGIALDASGTLFYATGGLKLFKLTQSGAVVEATLTTPDNATALAIDHSGALYVTSSNTQRLLKITGGVVTVVAGAYPYGLDSSQQATSVHLHLNPLLIGLAVDAAGDVYFPELDGNLLQRIDKLTPAGTLTAVNTPSKLPTHGDFTAQAVAISPTGMLYFSTFTQVYRSDPGGGVTLIAGAPGFPQAVGDGGLAIAAQLANPSSLAFDPSGNLYITEPFNSRVRKVNLQGIITTFAGTGQAGFTGDGGPASSARLSTPVDVKCDGAGNIYIADLTASVVRKVNTSGVITTVAGNGSKGNTGDGGPATQATLSGAAAIAVDPATGNLFIADRPSAASTISPATDNNRIRMVNRAGIITTITGSFAGYNGEGVDSTMAAMGGPVALAADAQGNIYVSEDSTQRIRKLSPRDVATLSSGGQAFTSQGGTGAITITVGPNDPWQVSSLPSWVTLTSPAFGVGSGTVTFQISANGGSDLFGSIAIAGQTFTVEQQGGAIPGLNFVGSMAHLAAEENWTTTFTLVNKSGSGAQSRLSVFGDALDPTGNGPLLLPLSFPQQTGVAGPLLAASFDRMIAGNASLIVNTAGAQSPPVLVGSAQLAATGSVDGFAIFHQIPTEQEAVVPMETRTASSYLLAFDNTNGLVLGVALQNVSAANAVIPVVIRDENGVLISAPGASITLPGNGHISFVLSDPALGFPVTANIRGTIEFNTPAGGRISVLGLRFTPPNNALTTIPALANVGTGGGSIAHLASGGDGWQTTFVLVNTGSSSTSATLSFFNDQTGLALPLPLAFPQQGGGASMTVPSYTTQLAAGATVVIVSSDAPQLLTGSAQLSTNGHVSGFVIFRHNGQEAVVPLESRNASSYIVAFDNTGGTATGVAINAVSAGQVTIPVTVRDANGTIIATDTIILSANGHYAFTLVNDKYPATANIRGTVQFDTPAGAQIGALGIRIPAGVAHTYTTLPALAK